jgi:hypothetical protein
MKTNILLTMALMAGMMLAGCSKDNENSEETRKGNNMEQTYKYDYFDEPIIDFSMNAEQVKESETHLWTSENLWDAAAEGFPDATDPFLVRFDYRNKEIPMIACYAFLDKEKGGIGTISLHMLNGGQEKAALQLEERYGSPSDSRGRSVYHNSKKNCYVLLSGNMIFYSTKPFE